MHPPLQALVIMGVAGCGKSSVSQALCQRSGAHGIEGDSFHPAANIRKMSAGILTDDDRAGWLDTSPSSCAVAADKLPVPTCSASSAPTATGCARCPASASSPGTDPGGRRARRPAPRPLHAGDPDRQPVRRPRAAARRTPDPAPGRHPCPGAGRPRLVAGARRRLKSFACPTKIALPRKALQ